MKIKHVISIAIYALLTQLSLAQTTIFLNENFDGKSRVNLVSAGWELLSNNSKVEVENDALRLKQQGWYLSPLLNEVAANYDQVVISFKYKNPSITYNSADKLEVYIGEDYQWDGNLGDEQRLILNSPEANSWQFFSYTLENWSHNNFQLCLKFLSNGGEDIFIDDLLIRGINITPGAKPGINIDASSRVIFEGDEITLFDMSTEAPSSFLWTISGTEGVDWDFINSSTASSQNPELVFHNKGFYDVSLEATNANGTSSSVYSGYITVSCPAGANTITQGYISNVSIAEAGLNNGTSNSSYSSFFDLELDLDASADFTLDLDLEGIDSDYWWGANGGNSRNVRCWFDWDRNGYYDDGYYDLTITNSGRNYFGAATISPPSTLSPGLITFRIKLANQAGDVADACGNVSVGEVEDYAINFYNGQTNTFLGDCISFNGGYAEDANGIVISGSTEFSMESWVYVANDIGDRGFFGQKDNVTLGIIGGQLTLTSEAGSVSCPWDYSSQWVHVAATGNASSLNLYLNGVLSATASTSGIHVSNPVNSFMLADGILQDVGNGNPFIGRFDELRIWNTCRTQTEIEQYLYQTTPTASSGLSAYYQFNEGVLGTEIMDYEGSNHLTLNKVAENYLNSSLPYKWLGSIDNDCANSSNWSWNEAELPRAANKGLITSNSSVVLNTGSSMSMGTLELMEGAHFTIESGADLTINDELIINNSSTSPASFINNGTTSSEITVNWNYDLNRYWYIGHSISDATINTYSATDGYKLYGYNGAWNNLTGGTLDSNPLTGYAMALNGTMSQISYTGTLNDTDLSKTLIDGWQLIANPYPSYYQLTEENKDNINADFYHTTGSAYVRTGSTPESRSLATFNVLSGISTPSDFDGVIAPGQCFWVMKETAGDIHMKTSKRIHETASLKSGKIEKDILRLELQNQYAVAEAVIAISDNGQEDISRLDSKIRMESGNKLSYIYSLKSDANTVINVLPSSIIKYEVAL
ncbi:LamG-like jellyroll fold domain-containing protein, partial [Carboxylicivirga sp. N1Y90]|uniref:LamG-like jellyroll fold domain-containing protein n=1 Tax=Carboxylicivirga fragile TaxID=3417571 RepID=UPI003D32AADE|nr:hypothetical protein [Marinilabiliaceae bacterium N1Y90]